MRRSSERILTTFVGSLVRPPELREHLRARESGEGFDPEAYERTLRASVAEAVRKQVEAGVDVVSDGEYGKSHWVDYILERVSGFEARPTPPDAAVYKRFGREEDEFPDFYSANTLGSWSPRQIVCTGPIAYNPAQLQRDIANFHQALDAVGHPRGDAFMPVVAPASFVRDAVNEHYPTEEAYVFAIAEALRHEYRAIVDAGLLLQVDDAVLATMWVVMEREGLDAYKRWARLRIEALNHALEGLPSDRIRYHLCWGSWPGPHVTDVPLREIVDLLLRVNAGAYAIEGANPRHEHEWKVWQAVRLPEGKALLPGVISHAVSHVEHPELVAERLVRYAEQVGRENVIGSSDCGFAQGQLYARVPPSIVWAKLRALADGARLASQQLWGTR